MNKIITTALIAATVGLTAPTAFAQTTPPANVTPPAAQGGAVAGGAAGAIGGAIIGGPIGAVIGGVAGAIGGATVGSLTAEDQIYARDYIVSRPPQRVVVQEQVVIGKPLPQTVRTYTIDGNPRLEGYRYAQINEHVVLIDRDGMVVGTVRR